MQEIERWPPGLIKRDDLAVDHGFIGEGRERLHDGGISSVEILAVPRSEMDLAVRLGGQGSIAVQLQLVCPIRALGQCARGQE